jgi:hypothetical protein
LRSIRSSLRLRYAGLCAILLMASSLHGLTPEEADAAIERGLEANSIVSARDYYDIMQFSSRAGHAQKFAGYRKDYEYTLLIRSCRQLLRFVAFRSKRDRSLDLQEVRASCLENDRVWIAVDEGTRNEITSGLLKKVLGSSGMAPNQAVSRIEVLLDGEQVQPLGEVQLDELGPGSSVKVFPVEPFENASEGKITVQISEKERAVSAHLKPGLLRRLFSD